MRIIDKNIQRTKFYVIHILSSNVLKLINKTV